MRKIYTFLLFCFLIAGLSFSAFADILPPSYYVVTVGDEPITRYTKQIDDEGFSYLAEDGTIPAGRELRVLQVFTLDGKKYGRCQERDYSDSWGNTPITARPWVSYYFLMEDVFSPEEMATAEDKPDPYAELLESNKEKIAAGESELHVMEETQSPQTDETTDEITAVSAEAPADAQSRAEMSILPVCIISAVVLMLTAVVTLMLIHRKRNNKQNEMEEGEER